MTTSNAVGLVDDRRPPARRRNQQERPRNGQSGRTSADVLNELPALAFFERIPVPAIAIDRNGAILSANAAFAALIGFTAEALAPALLTQAVHDALVAESVVMLGKCEVRIVHLTHVEGWIVRARVRRSPLWCADDAVVLAILEDLTERLWIDEQE